MALEAQRAELERLGFRIVESEADALVATAKRFHWDCMLTKMSYVVFVRRVPELTAEMIDADRESLQKRARSIDPSVLPRGFQKGTSVVAAYVADRVTPEAQQRCQTKPRIRFAYFYVPAVVEVGRTPMYLQTTPAWGALYYPKIRFLIQNVLAPRGRGGAGWPVSTTGALLTAVVAGLFLISIGQILAR